MNILVCTCALLSLQRSAPLAAGVHVLGVAGDKRSYNRPGRPHNDHFLFLRYGETLTIYCSGTDSKNLNIELPDYIDHGIIRPMEIVNTTTQKLVLENLGINYYDYVFTCTDVKTTGSERLTVDLRPVITVVSPNIRQKWLGDISYWVPVAEEYEVVCSGNPILSLTKNYKKIPIISVNETTIQSMKMRENDVSIFNFWCARSKPSPYSPSVNQALAWVYFGHPPAAIHFWCVEFVLQINCTWDALNMETTFTLIYTDNRGNSMDIYKDLSGTKKTMRCEWSLEYVWKNGLEFDKNISLVMKACNFFYCSNQSYLIDRHSILRVRSPRNLKAIKATTHGVVLTWEENAYDVDIPMEYKITYRLLGMEQELNASSLRGISSYRELKLELPCPGALYQLEVYVKFASTPQNNVAYWSEPATITFHTNTQESKDAVDPICNKEPEMIDNKYVAVYEVRKFKRRFEKDMLPLYEKVSNLKRKLEKIKKICEENNIRGCY